MLKENNMDWQDGSAGEDATDPNDLWAQSLVQALWKERTNCCKLSCDFLMGTMACIYKVYKYIHKHTKTKQKGN